MASVSITVPDALVPRLKTAMRALFPQHDALADAAAFRAVTADYWRDVLATYEAGVAADAARAAAVEKVVADGSGIQ